MTGDNTLETPWGKAQRIIELAPGIQRIITASHGGYRLSEARRQQMKEQMGFDHEWYEADHKLIIEGVFGDELGVEHHTEMLDLVDPDLLDAMRQPSYRLQTQHQAPAGAGQYKLLTNIIEKDRVLQKSADPSVPARERTALKLVSQVSNEEGTPYDLPWLIRSAMADAKFVHVEQNAGFAVFSFRDRSVMATLDNGKVYATPTGDEDNAIGVLEWLKRQGITLKGASH